MEQDAVRGELTVCDVLVEARYRSRHISCQGDEHIVPHEFRLTTRDGIVVGRMSADLVCVSEIRQNSLVAVCASHSYGLKEACEALFVAGTSDLLPDLNPDDDHVSRVLFIDRAVFLPCVSAEARQAMLYRIACSVLNYDDVIVGWNTLAGLAAPELKELGYVRIAGTGMVFCHLTRRNPYADYQELEGTLPAILVCPPATATTDLENLWRLVPGPASGDESDFQQRA